VKAKLESHHHRHLLIPRSVSCVAQSYELVVRVAKALVDCESGDVRVADPLSAGMVRVENDHVDLVSRDDGRYDEVRKVWQSPSQK
jgi:hypothetical protein